MRIICTQYGISEIPELEDFDPWLVYFADGAIPVDPIEYDFYELVNKAGRKNPERLLEVIYKYPTYEFVKDWADYGIDYHKLRLSEKGEKLIDKLDALQDEIIRLNLGFKEVIKRMTELYDAMIEIDWLCCDSPQDYLGDTISDVLDFDDKKRSYEAIGTAADILGLPYADIYKLDHSGVVYNTEGFVGCWDSGLVGCAVDPTGEGNVEKLKKLLELMSD